MGGREAKRAAAAAAAGYVGSATAGRYSDDERFRRGGCCCCARCAGDRSKFTITTSTSRVYILQIKALECVVVVYKGTYCVYYFFIFFVYETFLKEFINIIVACANAGVWLYYTSTLSFL